MELYELCKDEYIVNNEQTYSSYINQYVGHNMIKIVQKDERYLSCPLPEEVLTEVMSRHTGNKDEAEFKEDD